MINARSILVLSIAIFVNSVFGAINIDRPANGSLHPINSQVTVTLSGSGTTSVTITQTCGTSVVSQTIQYPTVNSAVFTLPQDYYGNCSYTLNVSASRRTIRVGNDVSITAPNNSDSFAAGTDFPIDVTYNPDTNPNPVFDVKLASSIPGLTVVEKIEGNALTQQYFHVPSDFVGDFILSVLETVPSYYTTNFVQLLITQQLEIVTPPDGAKVMIGTPFDVLVASKDASTNVPITLKFTDDATQNIPAVVNVVQPVTLDFSYFGTDSLTVEIDPSLTAYIAPSPISITLKYGIKFTQSPIAIIGNVPFQIYLETSDIPDESVDQNTIVSLLCGVNLIDQWTVPFNELSTLSAIDADTPAQSNCFFSTPLENDYYYPAVQSVIIFKPPFGGTIEIIGPVEQAEFAVSIAFPPSANLVL